MSVLFELQDAFKGYGEINLLDGAGFVLHEGHKVGLVGRNGCGKSTLCRVLVGDEELDDGQIVKHPRLRLGYLRQHDPFEPGESVLAFLMRDSGQPDWKCGEVAGTFGLKPPRLDAPVKELSGGWQTRVKLAALLLHEPNLLLLDEPTNFLDLRTQLMLERFLASFEGALLVVSHDRAFLKKVCDRTLELARGQLTMFNGNVDAYLEWQKEQLLHDERTNDTLQAKRKQLERFIAKNRARANTASQARSKAKEVERIRAQEKELVTPEATVQIRIQPIEARKGLALRCEDLSIGYPDRTVATEIKLELDCGQRAAVVGDNGEGKTTFLRTVVDSLPPIAGSFRWGHNSDIGVYAQHVYASLPPEETVRGYLLSKAAPNVSAQVVLNTAGSFLFRGDEVDKPVKVLSGGERARLCLAGLLLGRHNVLVLDEPGNHLDVETLEALSEAIREYAGTILFTSHDRYLVERIATCVIEVRDGHVANYAGGYADYLYYVEKEIAEGDRPAPAERATKDRAAMTDEERAAQKEKNRKLYELRRDLKSLERKIAKLEERKQALDKIELETADPAEAQRAVGELKDVAAKLGEAEDRWLKVHDEVEALEKE